MTKAFWLLNAEIGASIEKWLWLLRRLRRVGLMRRQ